MKTLRMTLEYGLSRQNATQFHSVIANLFVGRKFGIPTKAPAR